MTKTQLNWQSVDVNTLTPELREFYQIYLNDKKQFEQAMQNALGIQLAFSYKHGELSIAKVERKVEKGKVSFEQFMQAQQASGRRT